MPDNNDNTSNLRSSLAATASGFPQSQTGTGTGAFDSSLVVTTSTGRYTSAGVTGASISWTEPPTMTGVAGTGVGTLAGLTPVNIPYVHIPNPYSTYNPGTYVPSPVVYSTGMTQLTIQEQIDSLRQTITSLESLLPDASKPAVQEPKLKKFDRLYGRMLQI